MIVDVADAPLLRNKKWRAVPREGTCYVAADRRDSDGTRTTVYLHREIMGTPPGKHTDHINGDGLDNRRSNLRICTSAENVRNATRREPRGASKYVGVAQGRGGYWRAYVHRANRQVNIGSFDTELHAAAYRDRVEKRDYPDFTRANFPDGRLPDGSRVLTLKQLERLRRDKPSSSQYRGVRWHDGAWESNIRDPKTQRKVYLGRFQNEIDAAHAYDHACWKILAPDVAGPRINFP